jgi:negative regulator of sigma-B (phosphoserine phosphatase)
MRVEIGSSSRPAVGQSVCGDVYVTAPSARGTMLCLADGLGHGPAAREAAEAVCRYALAHVDEPLDVMLRGMDRALAGMRGAAVSVVTILSAARRMQFAGVGNVELRAAASARIAPPTTPGIVGHSMRRVRVWEYPLAPGDLLVLMSDGLTSRFELAPLAHMRPQELAEALVARYHKGHDDASCVAARIAAEAGGA